ncbi:endoribonuclease MazF [Gemmata sp.]|uniref:endoribonuclease MazF n=1 Tax=Gemmata sp. TaxID=1914242 RepID=UPI003F701E1E
MSDAAPTCPDRGHLVWISLDPQSGHEQAGRRPALVLSPAAYNGAVGLALFCPVTSHAKGYPFEVPLPAGLPVSGVVLADHVKCLDWRSRRAEFAGEAPDAVVAEVVRRLGMLLGTGGSDVAPDRGGA